MTQCILAIDSGSSAVKAAVVDVEGQIRGTGIAQIETILGEGGAAEQCPRQLWDAVLHASKSALNGARGDDCHVIGVACSSQYSSVIPVGADGEASGNLVLWRDTRGARQVRALLDAHPGAVDTWAEIHGLPPSREGRDTLAHMLHIKNDEPEVYERTSALLEPADFLSLKFSGVVSATPCSVFKMLLTDNRDSRAQSYDPTLVALSGIDPEKLPALAEPGTVLGDVIPAVAAELTIPGNAKVVCSMNDNHAVAMGTAALERATAGLSIGTTANISALIDGMKSDRKRRLSSMPTPLAGRNMVMAENGLGGKVLDISLDQIFYPDGPRSAEQRFADFEAAARRAAPGSGGVIFLPWLNGAGSPASNADARAGFLNISVDTTRDDLMRAMFEGIVFNLRWLNDAVEDFVETTFDHLMFTGGGAQSDTCAQIMADVFDRPIHQMLTPRYAPCRGLAFFAFCRIGVLGEHDQMDFLHVKQTYEPRPALRALYAEHFGQMLQAFDRTTPIVAALNQRTSGEKHVR
jgi:xylulokinase